MKILCSVQMLIRSRQISGLSESNKTPPCVARNEQLTRDKPQSGDALPDIGRN